jgi:hypothetical protein
MIFGPKDAGTYVVIKVGNEPIGGIGVGGAPTRAVSIDRIASAVHQVRGSLRCGISVQHKSAVGQSRRFRKVRVR